MFRPICYISSPLRFSMSTSFVRCLLWSYLFTSIFFLSQCDGICSLMVPLPQTKRKSVILLRTGRTDTGRISRFWNQTDARPLGEMRFYAFSQYERENDFGSHCLPTPSSPQPLPKFLLLSIMFNYWQTQKQPSIVQAIIALLIQWVSKKKNLG